MLRYITLLTFLCFATMAFGQITISADVNPAYKDGKQGDFEIVAKVMLTNTGSEATTFTWVRDESGFVNGWKSGVCDKNQCYFETTSTQSFDFEPGESGILDLHMYPYDVCGTGYAEIVVTDDNNAANTVTIRYDFDAETDDGSVCESSNSVRDFKLDYVKVYPNPANNFFTLTDVPSGLESIQIYNILGSKVKSFTASQNVNYDVSDLTKGLYLVNLTNAKGENLNTIKLHKN